ncbi:MAG: hypothetical protein K6T85_07215 [Gorillibacterium sp.]|nr:hypothetical protein [Gorillibacterium sp.]
MANSHHTEDKYSIIGVKERPEGKVIKGIELKSFIDSSNYKQLILNEGHCFIRKGSMNDLAKRTCSCTKM